MRVSERVGAGAGLLFRGGRMPGSRPEPMFVRSLLTSLVGIGYN